MMRSVLVPRTGPIMPDRTSKERGRTNEGIPGSGTQADAIVADPQATDTIIVTDEGSDLVST